MEYSLKMKVKMTTKYLHMNVFKPYSL
jgi:hypothetical protein